MDRRFRLHRDSAGVWHAAVRSADDYRAVRAAGLVDSGALEICLGLGLRDTAEAVAGVLGTDPRVRWDESGKYRVESDGELLPYSLLHHPDGWYVFSHTPVRLAIFGPAHRTRADALDALAHFLASAQ